MKHQPLITGRVLGYRCFQVLSYVNQTIATDGIAPSYDMIADALGISGGRPKVSEIVKRLERRGLMSRVGTGRNVPGTNTREVRRIALGVR